MCHIKQRKENDLPFPALPQSWMGPAKWKQLFPRPAQLQEGIRCLQAEDLGGEENAAVPKASPGEAGNTNQGDNKTRRPLRVTVMWKKLQGALDRAGEGRGMANPAGWEEKIHHSWFIPVPTSTFGLAKGDLDRRDRLDISERTHSSAGGKTKFFGQQNSFF